MFFQVISTWHGFPRASLAVVDVLYTKLAQAWPEDQLSSLQYKGLNNFRIMEKNRKEENEMETLDYRVVYWVNIGA